MSRYGKSRLPEYPVVIEKSALGQGLSDVSGSSVEDIANHSTRIESLRTSFSHSIRMRANGVKSNCFCYALGIPYLKFNRLEGPGLSFIGDYLESDALMKALMEIGWETKRDGDIVLYFENRIPSHAGLIENESVVSKWGNYPVYEHQLDEVPLSYGEMAGIYRKLSPCSPFDLFMDYFTTHPLSSAATELLMD